MSIDVLINRFAFTVAEVFSNKNPLQRWGIRHLLSSIDRREVNNPVAALRSAVGVLSITEDNIDARKLVAQKILDISKSIEESEPYESRTALEFMPLYPVDDAGICRETNKRLRSINSDFSYVP